MKNFAFYVSGNATRVKKFLYKNRGHYLAKQIKFILIDNVDNMEMKEICEDLSIILYEIDLLNIDEKNMHISNQLLGYLDLHGVDTAFIFANKILKGELLEKYKNRLINFHPSLLPSHKGLYAIDQALKENTFLLGNSAHIVTDDLDGGRVIMQNIFPSMNFSDYDEVLDKQLIMLLQLMNWINEDRLKIEKNKVYIKDAKYKVGEFIPNLEIIKKI